MKSILEAWLLYFAFKLGLIINEEVKDQINHRITQCKDCPLKKDNWCSRKVSVNGTKGCGCYLKAKYFAQYKIKICPLGKWEK